MKSGECLTGKRSPDFVFFIWDLSFGKNRGENLLHMYKDLKIGGKNWNNTIHYGCDIFWCFMLVFIRNGFL